MNSNNGEVVIALGNLLLVIMITGISGSLVDVSNGVGGTTVSISGTGLGFASATLLCFYLVFLWVKFQYFSRTFTTPKLIIVLGALGTCFAAFFYSLSAIFCLDSEFGLRTARGSMALVFFFVGALLHLVSDGFLVVKSEDYRQRLRQSTVPQTWTVYQIAYGVFTVRIGILCFVLFVTMARLSDQPLYPNQLLEAMQAWGQASSQTIYLSCVILSLLAPFMTVAASWVPEARSVQD